MMITINIPTVLLCIVYMFIGPALILLNKYILQSLLFPYPMFLSGLGVLVSGLVAQILVRFGFVELQRKEAVEGVLWYKRVLPVGLAHAGTLAFGNTVYLLLNVGFIQMLKSFTPVIIMIAAFFAGIEKPSRPVVLSILVISMGTAATCSFTPQMSLLGLFIMFLAEATEAIRLVLTQFLLQNLKFGVVEGQYVLAPATAFWLFLTSAIYEFPEMVKARAFTTILLNPLTFVAASTMGLGVNFLTYLVIQATSSLTMKVLGTIRNIFTIILGALFYAEVISLNEGLGYGLALAGFVAYNVAKSGYWDSKSTAVLPLVSEKGGGEGSESTGMMAGGGGGGGSGYEQSSQGRKKALEGLALKGLKDSSSRDDLEAQQPLLGLGTLALPNGNKRTSSFSHSAQQQSAGGGSIPPLQLKLDMSTTGTHNNTKKG